MGRLVSCSTLLLSFVLTAALVGCGGSSSSGASPTVPSSISLLPQMLSLDLGSTTSISATAKNYAGNVVTVTYTWTSNNPSIVSVATNGAVCAGTWDSLAAPVVCTPSGVGTAQITATSSGITSAPVTVYVHPHVDQIKISVLPPPAGMPVPASGCYSTTSTTMPADTQMYQASAYSNGTDISALVGPFTWSTSSAQVVTIKQVTGPNGVQNGQMQATAKVPGSSVILASISGTNGSLGLSSPLETFTTCSVQSITLALSSGGTSFSGPKGTGFSITPTVIDSNSPPRTITGVPLTWTSNSPAATVSASGGVSNTNPGGASITASCTPPTCNANLTNASGVPLFQPVYAPDPITAVWTSTSTTPTAPTIYVSTTGCAAIPVAQNCTTAILPISGTTAALGGGASTTNVPNSLRFDPKGTTVYVGSANGLMQVAAGTPPTLSVLSSAVKGKILAISPDGKRVIVTDTNDTPNLVFIYDASSATPAITTLLITGATAAAFSPDDLKAFIVAHDPSSGANTLNVYSTQLPLQTGTLAGLPSDVAFLGNGMLGYIAEGSQLQYVAMCDNPGPLTAQLGTVSAPGSFIRSLPGNSFLTFASPNVARVNVTVSPATLSPGQIGCPSPPLGPANGGYTISTPPPTVMSLGQGNFTPIAFAVSTDGQKAYLLAPSTASLIVYDITNQTTSTIPLVGSPAPLAGGLAPDGQSFYVTASDGNLHVINLIAGGDVQQLAIPSRNLCAVSSGTINSCLPDLLAVP